MGKPGELDQHSSLLFNVIQREFVGDLIDKLWGKAVRLGIGGNRVFQFAERDRIIFEVLPFKKLCLRIDENQDRMDLIFRKINIFVRLVLCAGGLLMLDPGLTTDLIGIGLLAGAIIFQRFVKPAAKPAE